MATFFAVYETHADATDEELVACECANDENCFNSSVDSVVRVCTDNGFEAQVFETVYLDDGGKPGKQLGYVDCEGMWHTVSQ